MSPFPLRIHFFLLPALLILSLSACVSIESSNRLQASFGESRLLPVQCEQLPAMTDIPAAALDGDGFSLLNWNIYKEDADDWQQDLSHFAAGHDLLILQEARLRSELDELLQTQQLAWSMNTAFYLDGEATGVMTAARTPALYRCGFKTTEPLIRIPKATLISYYAIEGSEQKLLVANIHGINFTLGMEAYQQQLDELYAAIRHHRGPMIVAGDFNSWSEERMAAVKRLREALGLSALEYEVNNKTHLFGNAIDHVFYRGLEPMSKKVWQVSSSDHNPISVRFRLAAASDEAIARR